MKRSSKLEFTTRSAPLESTINELERSVSCIIATEAPTMVMDMDSYDTIREILLIDGANYPESGQVVLLDNHSRYEGSTSVKGSIRDIKRDGQNLRGTVYFASTPDVSEIWTKVKERHLTDVSAGYHPFKEDTIRLLAGESTVISGRSFKNDYPDGKDLVIRKKWMLKEVSVTPIGADEYSKLNRTEQTENKNLKPKESIMTPEELKRLQDDQARKDLEQKEAHRKEIEEATRSAEEAGKKKEQSRQTEIRSFISLLPESRRSEVEAKFISSGIEIDAARKEIIEEVRKSNETKTIPPDTSIVADESDKFRSAAIDSVELQVRSQIKVDGKRDLKRENNARASGLNGLHNLVRECAYRENPKSSAVHRMDGQAIYEYASRAFSVASGDLPAIMLDATNKMVGDSFDEEPTSFARVSDVGNAKDFKDVNVVMKSGLSDWKKIRDGQDFEMGTFKDRYEKGAVETYGLSITIPRKVWINDDLGMLQDMVEVLGAGAARKQNMDFYDYLCGAAFAGPIMNEDGYAAFLAAGARYNIKATSGVVSISGVTVSEAVLKAIKRQKPDKDSKQLRMGYPATILLTGTDRQRDIETVMYTNQDITKAIAGVNNPFYQKLDIVFDNYYQDYATTASAANSYHLFSRKPIRVLYLNGNQRPTVRRAESQVGRALGTTMDAYHDYGFIFKDWRLGVYCDGK